jgi:hypothetical protein
VWGSAVLAAGALIARVLTALEHLDFLVSIREEKFKMMYDAWQLFGWWIAIGIGGVWALNRFSKRNEPHGRGPTWGLVIACTIVSFVFGSLIAVQSVGGIPNIIISQRAGLATGASGDMTLIDPCRATIDMAQLESFRKDFKLALVCNALDPTIDSLSDTNIWVSNLFEITPGEVEIIANKSPFGDFLKTSKQLTVNHFAVLVPRDVPWKKITTLADLMRLGGKVLTPQYYH